MKWVKTAFIGLLSVAIIVPLFWLVWLRAGPTAVGPTEDPVITWNRAHEGLTENAAPYYEQAILLLEQAEQPEHWDPEDGICIRCAEIYRPQCRSGPANHWTADSAPA